MFCLLCFQSHLKAAGQAMVWALTWMTFSTSLSQICNTLTVTGEVIDVSECMLATQDPTTVFFTIFFFIPVTKNNREKKSIFYFTKTAITDAALMCGVQQITNQYFPLQSLHHFHPHKQLSRLGHQDSIIHVCLFLKKKKLNAMH